MAAQEDADALTVCAFENELEEFLQETPEMHDAMTTYLEARTRLLEKRRNRGFWPTKGRGSGKMSKGKSKGKRSREQLLARIARSHCRKCGMMGHWKAECPMNSKDQNNANPTASANVATDENECLEEEVYSEPEPDSQARVLSPVHHVMSQCPNVSEVCPTEVCYMAMFQITASDHQRLHSRMSRFLQGSQGIKDNHNGIDKMNKTRGKGTESHAMQPNASDSKMNHTQIGHRSFATARTPEVLIKTAMTGEVHFGQAEAQVLLSVANGSSHAILDTGASRCIIGEKVLNSLKAKLPTSVSNKLKTSPSQIKFRFGNNESLTSSFRVHFPLRACDQRIVWLAVEVVPGSTPFLFSKRAFKLLGGVLDTVHDTCRMHRLHSEPITLTISNTGLYLIDIGELCQGDDNMKNDNQSTAFVGESCLKTHERAGEQGSLSHLNVQFSFARQRQKPESKCFTTASALKVPSDPPNFPSCLSETCQNADHGESFQDRGRIVDSGFDAAASSDDSTHRDCSSGQPDCRGPTRVQHSDPSDDGRASQSTYDSGELHATAEDELPESRKHCKFGLQEPQDQVRGQSFYADRSLWNWGKSPDGQRRAFTSSNAMVLGGVRRRRDCGGGGDRDHQCQSTPIIKDCSTSSPATGSAAIHRGVGVTDCQLGKEASRKDLRSDSATGSSIPRVVPEEIHVLDTGDARSSEIWPTQDEPKSSRGFSSGSVMNPEFHQQIQQTRNDMSNECSWNLSQQELLQQVHKAEEVFDQHMCDVNPKLDFPKGRIFLLEVYAGRHSPLTDAVKQLGLPSVRFSREDGDLSTIAGRAKLWSLIERTQPEHIWVAPECGPWSGWNHLNQQKSMSMFDTIQNKQREQLPHLQLCVKLCQYQIKRQRHFYLEQPQGSSLIKQDVMIPILKHVMLASFDMCSFGLRIPGTQKYLKKGSMVITTSRQFHELLHDHKCPGGHTHQRIEGSISLNGVSTKLTHFCATYCQGFAKAIAKFLCHRTHTMCLPSEALAIDLDDENEPPAKRFKFLANPHKRRKPNEPLDLETPPTSDDASGSNRHPPDTAIVGSEASAVPEQTGVQSPAGESQPWQLVMQLAQSAAPRVGNMRCDADSEIFSQVCQLVPQIQVESIFICRGTERFQVPIHAPASHGCPIRYTVCLHRHTNQIHDLGPENWHNMTRARRIRNCIPAR